MLIDMIVEDIRRGVQLLRLHHKAVEQGAVPGGAIPVIEAGAKDAILGPLTEDEISNYLKYRAMIAADVAPDWRTSIVDLLKILGMDSGTDARAQLAYSLQIGGTVGSAEQNIALHTAVMEAVRKRLL